MGAVRVPQRSRVLEPKRLLLLFGVERERAKARQRQLQRYPSTSSFMYINTLNTVLIYTLTMGCIV